MIAGHFSCSSSLDELRFPWRFFQPELALGLYTVLHSPQSTVQRSKLLARWQTQLRKASERKWLQICRQNGAPFGSPIAHWTFLVASSCFAMPLCFTSPLGQN